jgi:hypothetical protein
MAGGIFHDYLRGPWEQVRDYLIEELEQLNGANQARTAATFVGNSSKLQPSVFEGDASPATRYVANTGTDNAPAWDQVSLGTGVKGRLKLSNFLQATANILLGRGAGNGDYQPINLGANLQITGDTLDTVVSPASTDATFITKDDETADLPNSRKLVAGDRISIDVATPGELALSSTANLIGQGNIGAEPASPSAGDTYFTNNSPYLESYSGSVWNVWGPIYPLTKPNNAAYAWVNQGGASVSTGSGGIYLSAPATAGDSLRIRKKASPSTPFTITGAFLMNARGLANVGAGLLFRESSSGKLVTLSYENDGSGILQLAVRKWTDATTSSATYLSELADSRVNHAPTWLRIADNGTNRICSISADGQNWMNIHSVSNTDFLTANEVGFYCNAGNSTSDAGMNLVSWKEA